MLFLNYNVLVLSTITYAMKGRDILRKQGITSYVERVSMVKEGQSCGYGLYIPEKIEDAEEILAKYNIKVIERTVRK